MGREGTETPVLAALMPLGPHDRQDVERSQRGTNDLATQENKITEREGEGAFPKRKRKKWKKGFA